MVQTLDAIRAGDLSRRPWLRLFLSGLGLWLAAVMVTFLTANANLIPTLVLLGSFLLHGLWNSMHSIALTLTLALTKPHYVPVLDGWLVQPTQAQVNLFTVLQWGGWAVICAVGIGWLVALWRRTPSGAQLRHTNRRTA